jgi:hypothetical protein
MKQKNPLLLLMVGSMLSLGVFTLSSCDDDDDDIVLPPIGGYNSSDEVGAANLVGYWGFEGNGNEAKSGTAPTAQVGATYGAGGVKGQALTLTNGYLYYASALAPLASNQAFTLSAWIQVKNTGGSPTAPANVPYQYFTSAVPGQFWGNLNGLIEAGQFNYTSDSLRIKSIYRNAGGGTQDNINNGGVPGVDHKYVKKAGTNQWVHIVTTYNPNGGTGNESIFRIYGDSALISNPAYENRGTNSFVYTANEIIIGGWYNNIPGKEVSTDTWTVPFNGKIDEIRVWNKLLPESDIVALYQLGKAGR